MSAPSDSLARFGTRGTRGLVRLDLNESPFPPPAGAVRRIRAAASHINEYPVTIERAAREAVAHYFSVADESVLLTTGIDEATDLCLLEFRDLRVLSPGFHGYAARARALNRRVRAVRLRDHHCVPPALWQDANPDDIVMLASPNNPSGIAFSDASLLTLLSQPAHVVLDEAYADFAGHAPGIGWLESFPHLLVFRSFSKSFALAGLRIGALIGNAALIARLRARQSYLSVDRFGLEGMLGAIEDNPGYPRELASRIEVLRESLVGGLRQSGLFTSVLDSEANFVLAHCRDQDDAEHVREGLIRRSRIVVAAADRFGVPAGLRISVCDEATQARLFGALSRIGLSMASRATSP